ncbi:MAG: SurA N-terminal domain-containing protein, partial [Bacteroidales bacterium]|nr:SurA N-terminal domain-containing protein [Bacteroidales bacterium]
MATLQTLRNRAGVLMAVVIGLSLLAFILGDFLNSGASFLQRNQMEIGEINGKSINYFDFQARVEQSVESYKQNSGMTSLDEGTYASIRNQVWNNYMNEMLFEDEYKSLGLGCSSDELFDMVQGQNIHPQILQAPVFQNQVTGMFDRSLVIQFLKNMELEPTGQQKALWVEYEKELVKDRIFT